MNVFVVMIVFVVSRSILSLLILLLRARVARSMLLATDTVLLLLVGTCTTGFSLTAQ